jgi:hypothetical protein
MVDPRVIDKCEEKASDDTTSDEISQAMRYHRQPAMRYHRLPINQLFSGRRNNLEL